MCIIIILTTTSFPCTACSSFAAVDHYCHVVLVKNGYKDVGLIFLIISLVMQI